MPTSGSDRPIGRPSRQVVAIILRRGEDVGLFRRSQRVSHDRGLWHCLTGYLSPHTSALDQACQEIWEETGLARRELTSIAAGPVISLPALEGPDWVVHTFAAETDRESLQLNWEHEAYRWTHRPLDDPVERVWWLADVLDAVPRPSAGHQMSQHDRPPRRRSESHAD